MLSTNVRICIFIPATETPHCFRIPKPKAQKHAIAWPWNDVDVMTLLQTKAVPWC